MEVRIYTLSNSPTKGETLVVRTNDKNELLYVSEDPDLVQRIEEDRAELKDLDPDLVEVLSADSGTLEKLRGTHTLCPVDPEYLGQLYVCYSLARKHVPPKEAFVQAKQLLRIAFVYEKTTDVLRPGTLIWEEISWKDGFQNMPPGYQFVGQLPTVIAVKVVIESDPVKRYS